MEMASVILCNGDFPRKEYPLWLLRSADRIVCCDASGTVAKLEKMGLEPSLIVGDMDKTILLTQKHHHNSKQKQQCVNVLQPESSSKSSLGPEINRFPEDTNEVVGKSVEDLLNHEMVLQDELLPIMKDTESENIFSPVGALPNTSVSSASELEGHLKNTELELIQPGSADSVKGGNPHCE